MAYGPDLEGNYNLHGYKWFTSATDANMAFTLARVATETGEVTAVSYSNIQAKLLMFYLSVYFVL